MKLNPEHEIKVVPTGLPQFDKLLGVGGYPRGYLTMISGQPGAGKTTLAIQAILEAQKLGLQTLYVETDYKFVPSYFASLGVILSDLRLIQGEVGEDILLTMVKELESGKYGLVIVDTISKITPREEIEKDFDSQTIGKQAKLVSRFLRKLKPLANHHNIAVVLLNHEREDIMTGAISTPGGRAIQEDVVIWVRMSHTGDYLKQGDKVVGKRIKAKIWRKNQVAPTEGHEVVLEVFNGLGFSATADLMQEAIDKGIITLKGQMYYFEDEKVARGKGQLRDKFRDESFAAKVQALL